MLSNGFGIDTINFITLYFATIYTKYLGCCMFSFQLLQGAGSLQATWRALQALKTGLYF